MFPESGEPVGSDSGGSRDWELSTSGVAWCGVVLLPNIVMIKSEMTSSLHLLETFTVLNNDTVNLVR